MSYTDIDLALKLEQGIDKINSEFPNLEEVDFMEAGENAGDVIYDEFKGVIELDTAEKLERWLEVYSVSCYEIDNQN